MLDLAERAAAGSAPERAERAGSPVVRKPVRALAGLFVLDPLARERLGDLTGVSSAEKTSVTPRPKTRWKIGRIRG
jgi:hypothetical protein